MGETVTPRSGRTGPGNHDHATLRQQGLFLLAGLDNRELPRGPSSVPHQPTSHPLQDPVRTRPSARPDRERPSQVAFLSSGDLPDGSRCPCEVRVVDHTMNTMKRALAVLLIAGGAVSLTTPGTGSQHRLHQRVSALPCDVCPLHPLPWGWSGLSRDRPNVTSGRQHSAPIKLR